MDNNIYCKSCGKQLKVGDKHCTSCGREVTPVLKKKNNGCLIAVLITGGISILFFGFIFIIILIGGVARNNNEDNGEQSTIVVNETKENNVAEEQDLLAIPIRITVDELFEALDKNALNASTTYEDQYVEITGILNNIDAQGDYFTLGPLDGKWSLDSVHCKIGEEHLEQVMELSVNQQLTVIGTITEVGEILGYYLDVQNINSEATIISTLPDDGSNQETKPSTEEVTTDETKEVIITNDVENTESNQEIDSSTEEASTSEISPNTDASATKITTSQKNALSTAKNYLNYTSFSKEGLISQLEYEGFSTEDGRYGAENCGADWMEEAIKSAKNYLEFSSFSKTGLINQLEYEKFTTEEAKYGAENCGADWMEEAIKSAKNYLDFSSFSKEGLISQLEYEGFTTEEAKYGVENCGADW